MLSTENIQTRLAPKKTHTLPSPAILLETALVTSVPLLW